MAATVPRPAQFYRTRKMATFLPLIGVPFLAVLFWAGDGGKASGASLTATKGLNMELPKAEASTLTTNKLEAFTSAKDSLTNRDLVSGGVADTAQHKGLDAGVSGQTADQLAMARLQLKAVQDAQRNGGQAPLPGAIPVEQQLALQQAEHQRELDQMRADNEVERLNAQVYAPPAPKVAPAPKKVEVPETKADAVDEEAVVSQLGSNGSIKNRATVFRTLGNESEASAGANTLTAVIHESREVVSGSLIKMRLTQAAVVNGHPLPANSFIYGKCNLSGERLNISIVSLKSGNNVFPATLQVFDVDGLPGVHIPGAIGRDAAKEAGASTLDGADMMTMSPNAATAAAGLAVGAVKSVTQKKIRLVKVKLKAGYVIMLKPEKSE